MKRIVHLIASVLLLCFFGCKHNIAYTNYIQDGLTESYPNWSTDYDSIFIIPRLGCKSCTNIADGIIKSRFGNKRNLFILTNLQSKKLLRIQFGKENVERKNVIVDSTNKYWKLSFPQSPYPVLLVTKTDGTLDFKNLLDSGIK